MLAMAEVVIWLMRRQISIPELVEFGYILEIKYITPREVGPSQGIQA